MPRDATRSVKIITAPSYRKILTAAISLFAERGFKGTTTAAIARKAAVNEALIYRHFPTKEDLYCAIIREKIESPALVRLLKLAADGSASPEKFFRSVAEQMVFTASSDPAFLRLYYHSAMEGHRLAKVFYERYVCQYVSLIATRIRAGIACGEFRKVNPEIAAEAFIGMLRNYNLTNELFHRTRFKKMRAAAIREFVGLFLRGIAR
jgi:AcrR family transcriptional regulator